MSEPTLTVTQTGADPASATTDQPTPPAPTPTPSQQFIDKAKAEVVVTDPKGRVIVLKRPGILGQFRLIELLGETASNAVYVNMVLPLIYVSSIDGEACSFTSKRQLEALILQLDEDGLSTVMEGVSTNFGKTNPDADKAALKN